MDRQTFDEKCKKCVMCRKVYANGGWSFWGCYHEPYHGKWVAEIKTCPKTEKGENMTPLEKARLRAKEPPACKDCPDSERVGKVLYCKISGKMILPRFEHICLCRGERLKERQQNE